MKKNSKERVLWDSSLNDDDIEIVRLEHPDFSESDIFDTLYEVNNQDIHDLRTNLNITLSGEILVIASLGLWYGRRCGYRLLNSKNLQDIFYTNAEEVKWFTDGKDLKAEEYHHDGTNYLMYREVKKGVNIYKLLESIYNGETVSNKRLAYYTKSILPHINKVYGC